MRASGEEPRPAVLFRQFNAKYRGRSVSFQTASRWLGGGSIPAQDKLQVLAELYGVAPHVLRFGEKRTPRIAEGAAAHWGGIGTVQDRAAFDAYLTLSAAHRKLVRELIEALAGR